MNRKLQFAKEFVVAMLVATLLSSVIALLLSFVLMNLGMDVMEMMTYVNITTSIIWGLFVGYRLNTLVREYQI